MTFVRLVALTDEPSSYTNVDVYLIPISRAGRPDLQLDRYHMLWEGVSQVGEVYQQWRIRDLSQGGGKVELSPRTP